MPLPFAPTVILISLHNTNLNHHVSTPTIDTISCQGVSTAIYLTSHQRSILTKDTSLASLVFTIAQNNTQFNHSSIHLIQVHELQHQFPKGKQSLPNGLFIIDAAQDLIAADNAAKYLYKLLSDRKRSHLPVRVANKPNVADNPKVSVALLGILSVTSSDYTNLIHVPQTSSTLNQIPIFPIQTCRIGLKSNESLQLAGIVSWCGDGLSRRDTRTSFFQLDGPVGEGCLRIDQMINEVLSKVALKDKYGA